MPPVLLYCTAPVLPGRDGHVVEVAEAEGLAVLGVVPGRPHQRHPVTEEARTHCRRVSMFYLSILSKNQNRSRIPIYTFIDELDDGPGGDLGGCGGVDVVPDGVGVHAPAAARQPRHGQTLRAAHQRTRGVQGHVLRRYVDMETCRYI